MRVSLVTGMFTGLVVGLCLLKPSVAQESDLQSVLRSEDDLRSLIDLDVPDAPAPPVIESKPADDLQLNRATSNDKSVVSVVEDPATKKSETIVDPLMDLGLMTTDVAGGAKVRGVFVDSPASRAGFKSGDKIISVGSKATKSTNDLAKELSINMVNNSFYVIVMRGGKKKVVNVTMKQSPAYESPDAIAGRAFSNSNTTTDSVPSGVASSTSDTVANSSVVGAPNVAKPADSSQGPQSVLRRSVSAQPVSTANAPETIATPNPVSPIPNAAPPSAVQPATLQSDVAESVAANSVPVSPIPVATPPAATGKVPATLVPDPAPPAPAIVNQPPAAPAVVPRRTTRRQSVVRAPSAARVTPRAVPSSVNPATVQNPVVQNPVVQNPVAAQRVVPRNPKPYPVLDRQPQQVTQQRVIRYVPQQQVIRGQNVGGYRPAQRYVPQQRVAPAPSRPVIGSGGRLIGNGRVLNSALRVIGL